MTSPKGPDKPERCVWQDKKRLIAFVVTNCQATICEFVPMGDANVRRANGTIGGTAKIGLSKIELEI